LIGAIFTIELFTIMILKPYAGRLSDAVDRIKTISLGLMISSIGITGMTFLKSCEGLIFSIIIFSIGVAFTTAATPPSCIRACNSGKIWSSNRRDGDY